MRVHPWSSAAGIIGLLLSHIQLSNADAAAWKQLFTGPSLDGWDTYLAAPPGSKTPLGLNPDPRGVFTVEELP